MTTAPNGMSAAIIEADLAAPVAWLARRTDEELLAWLRGVAWRGELLPFVAPVSTDGASFLASHLRDAPPLLVTRLRALLPLLFREWGTRDPESALDDLLVVAAGVRCAAAEPDIAAIARERLQGRSQEIALRRRCLSVLAGFGVTSRTLSLFRAHLDEPGYTALCYRALYRHDLLHAVSELPRVMDAFSGEPDKLHSILQLLFHDRRATDVLDLLAHLLRELPEERLLPALKLLARIGIQLNAHEAAGGREELRVTRALGRDPAKAWSYDFLGVIDASHITDERVPLILDAAAADPASSLHLMLGEEG